VKPECVKALLLDPFDEYPETFKEWLKEMGL